jgi:hypothetical protein
MINIPIEHIVIIYIIAFIIGIIINQLTNTKKEIYTVYEKSLNQIYDSFTNNIKAEQYIIKLKKHMHDKYQFTIKKSILNK